MENEEVFILPLLWGRSHHRMLIAVLAGVVLASLPGRAPAADLKKGVELYQAKKYREAADELRLLVESAPDSRQARYYLGLSLVELGRFEDAIRQFQALENDTELGADQIKVGLARAQMGARDMTAAKASLDEALDANPNNPEVHLRLSEWYLHRKDYARAAKAADKSIELAPGTAYAYYFGGIAYSNLRRPDKMVDYFRAFLKLAPDAPETQKVQSLLRSVR